MCALPSANLLPSWPQLLGLGQVQVRGLELSLSLPLDGRHLGSKASSANLLSSRVHANRKLGPKQYWDSTTGHGHAKHHLTTAPNDVPKDDLYSECSMRQPRRLCNKQTITLKTRIPFFNSKKGPKLLTLSNLFWASWALPFCWEDLCFRFLLQQDNVSLQVGRNGMADGRRAKAHPLKGHCAFSEFTAVIHPYFKKRCQIFLKNQQETPWNLNNSEKHKVIIGKITEKFPSIPTGHKMKIIPNHVSKWNSPENNTESILHNATTTVGSQGLP